MESKTDFIMDDVIIIQISSKKNCDFDHKYENRLSFQRIHKVGTSALFSFGVFRVSVESLNFNSKLNLFYSLIACGPALPWLWALALRQKVEILVLRF